jgi:uncharacterized membrane protein
MTAALQQLIYEATMAKNEQYVFKVINPKVKVKVTLRLTVSQSVCLGVEPKYGTFDQSFFFESYSLVIFGAPSLTRGRVCHVSVSSLKSTVVCHFYKIFTLILQFTMLNTFTKNKIFKHLQK